MFTQCSKCETVFRLSADALRAAGGQVRCGRCGEVFNALSRLAEDANGFSKGESPLFLETRAEEILESSAADIDIDIDIGTESDEFDLASGTDVARLQFIGLVDDELAEETSLEFTLPPGDLDRIFIDTRVSPLRRLTADGDHGDPGGRAERSEVIPLHPEPPPHPESVVAPPPTRIAGLEVSDDVRQEMLSSVGVGGMRELDPLQTLAGGPAARPRLQFAAWLTAAGVLGFLLLLQLLRGNGDWVAAHVPLLGGAGATSGSLSVYQLRQWGVTGDPAAKGTLRVRASIMNTAPQLQPYPLLRVTLVNRFGSRIGAREFDAAEYLGHGSAQLLAPGERVDATLDILDPGKDAEGFEIDVCLRNADKTVCAGDAPAQAR